MASKKPESNETPEVEDVVDTPEPEVEEVAEKSAGKQPSTKQVAANNAAIKASKKATADLVKENKEAGIVAHIEVLKGVQWHDHQADILYRRGHLTPVTKLSSWAKRQAKHGLLKIHRIGE
jgi:hypothetical protein